jgi:hypothetical protein
VPVMLWAPGDAGNRSHLKSAILEPR